MKSDDSKPGDSMRVDTALIRELADLLTAKDLTEIEVEDSDRRVVVKRKIGGSAPTTIVAPAPMPAVSVAAQSAAPAPAGAGAEESAANHPGAVKSPMVGTVYLASDPSSPPFVTAGQKVAAGDTLLIVEAMKVMNAIPAPRAGTVRQVLVENAQPVEYDQPLVIID